MNRFVRPCLYALAGAIMLGLTGCSLVSNGYGGWYWQEPEIPTSSTSTPIGMNNTNSNSTHAKSGMTGHNGSRQG